MKPLAALVLCAVGVTAQTASQGTLVATSQAVFAIAKNDFLRSADKIPEHLWSYKPSPDVRSFPARRAA